jgi:hypothetical protein
MNYETWLVEVCKYLQSTKYRGKDLEEIFSHINLSDSKLAFLDGEDPFDYSKNY